VAELDRGALIAATATSMALLLGTAKGTAGRVTVATITYLYHVIDLTAKEITKALTTRRHDQPVVVKR